MTERTTEDVVGSGVLIEAVAKALYGSPDDDMSRKGWGNSPGAIRDIYRREARLVLDTVMEGLAEHIKMRESKDCIDHVTAEEDEGFHKGVQYAVDIIRNFGSGDAARQD
jgi:hypothetical protein